MWADSNNLITAITSELQMAEIAHCEGNKGKARVCARRAAGWAIRVWQTQHGIVQREQSAYRHLQVTATDDTLPVYIQAAAGNLITRINEEHNLPVDVDFLGDARVLIDFFLDSDNGP